MAVPARPNVVGWQNQSLILAANVGSTCTWLVYLWIAPKQLITCYQFTTRTWNPFPRTGLPLSLSTRPKRSKVLVRGGADVTKIRPRLGWKLRRQKGNFELHVMDWVEIPMMMLRGVFCYGIRRICMMVEKNAWMPSSSTWALKVSLPSTVDRLSPCNSIERFERGVEISFQHQYPLCTDYPKRRPEPCIDLWGYEAGHRGDGICMGPHGISHRAWWRVR